MKPTYGRHKSPTAEEKRLLVVLNKDGVERVILGRRSVRHGGGSWIEVTSVLGNVVSLRTFTPGAVIRVQAMCRDKKTAVSLASAIRQN